MQIKNRILTYFIIIVWLSNGLFCKVLNLVPRHQQIVAKILSLNNYHSRIITITMAIWILSRFKTKLNAIAQIIIIATMNAMEFVLAPDLLLWGKTNSLFALLFIVFIYFNEFYLNKKLAQQT
jgi:DoxX-like family